MEKIIKNCGKDGKHYFGCRAAQINLSESSKEYFKKHQALLKNSNKNSAQAVAEWFHELIFNIGFSNCLSGKTLQSIVKETPPEVIITVVQNKKEQLQRIVESNEVSGAVSEEQIKAAGLLYQEKIAEFCKNNQILLPPKKTVFPKQFACVRNLIEQAKEKGLDYNNVIQNLKAEEIVSEYKNNLLINVVETKNEKKKHQFGKANKNIFLKNLKKIAAINQWSKNNDKCFYIYTRLTQSGKTMHAHFVSQPIPEKNVLLIPTLENFAEISKQISSNKK